MWTVVAQHPVVSLLVAIITSFQIYQVLNNDVCSVRLDDGNLTAMLTQPDTVRGSVDHALTMC